MSDATNENEDQKLLNVTGMETFVWWTVSPSDTRRFFKKEEAVRAAHRECELGMIRQLQEHHSLALSRDALYLQWALQDAGCENGEQLLAWIEQHNW